MGARSSTPPCERVLIVEDDPDTLYALAELLHLSGVGVTHAARTLPEAEQALASGFRPSVVLLDLNLEGEPGEALVETIRRNPVYQDTRVVAFSGDRIGLLRLGEVVDAALLKPAEPAKVLETLYEVCNP